MEDDKVPLVSGSTTTKVLNGLAIGGAVVGSVALIAGAVPASGIALGAALGTAAASSVTCFVASVAGEMISRRSEAAQRNR
jgi:hypothetical protein